MQFLVVGFQFSPIDFQQSNKTLKMISLLHTNPSNTHTALIKVCSQQDLPGRKGPLTVTLSTLTFLVIVGVPFNSPSTI